MSTLRTGGAPKLPMPLQGVVPPLVTPLTEDSALDRDGLRSVVNHVLAGDVQGLFLLGSTGEFCSLSTDTRRAVIDEGCTAVAGRVPVVINVSDTCLEESIQLAQYAARAGAAAVAICPPYYYSATQLDLVRYASKFAARVEVPVLLYNIPQHAHVEFAPETIIRLAEVSNIVGIKNSNGSLDYLATVKCVKSYRPSFSLLVGNEEIMLSALDAGADGSVCGGANLFPHLYAKLYQTAAGGCRLQAEALQALAVRVAEAIYTIGPAPTAYLRGLKSALAHLGICGSTLAEPLGNFAPEEQEELCSRLRSLLPDLR
ncbi:MAG: dihydrodipicolinate synthase family protein [Acidobacteriaceae bacterium]|nr:dihydrodipicolinate synthase family protein [Acidobacteriaceae bacterium]